MTKKRTLNKASTSGIFLLLILLFIVMILWRHIVITIPAGHVGVMWWRFFGGTDVTSPPREEGTHFIFPWDELVIYDARLQEQGGVFDVVTVDGLNIGITASIRWSVVKNNLGRLHKFVGPEYVSRLIFPEVGSVLRETIAKYRAEDLYASNRRTVQEAIYRGVVDNPNGIGPRNDNTEANLLRLVDVLVKQVQLPSSLTDAIERKFSQAELVQEYRFRVQREELESQRKGIEAEGIRKFQETVTPGISDAYLRWTGIEATLKLAQSPNSKVVILGNGPGGLPVILNGFDSEKPTLPTDATQAKPADATSAKRSLPLPTKPMSTDTPSTSLPPTPSISLPPPPPSR